MTIKIKDTIKEIRKIKMLQKLSKHYGQYYLVVEGTEYKIKVFKDLLKDKKIYGKLEKGGVIGKTFIFDCLKYGKDNYRMTEAKEVKDIAEILKSRNDVLGDNVTWISSTKLVAKDWKTSYSSFAEKINSKKLNKAINREIQAEVQRITKLENKIVESRVKPSLCNLAEYELENIHFEDDIWKEYNGENTPWLQKHANKESLVFYNPTYCLSDFSKWEPLFKGVDACLDLINNVQLIIIPQRDIIFKVVKDRNNEDAFYLGVNYANALAIVEFEENFKQRQKPCQTCDKIFVPSEWFEEVTQELTDEQKKKAKAATKEEFKKDFCFKCQSRWLREIGGLTVIKFPKFVNQRK